MKQKITFLLCFVIPLFCMAQNGLLREYEYDAAGNRTSRKVINLTPPLAPPPPPENPTLAEEPEEELTSLMPLTPLDFTEPAAPEPTPEYFVEKVARVEIKIYPNPTTEKITLEIANMENLQTGVFKLFSLTGQFLQEQPVHSATTIVSLAGLPTGTYILKVHINDRTENWKIIKN